MSEYSENFGLFERLICYFIASERYDLFFSLLDQIEDAYKDKIYELIDENEQLKKYIDHLEDFIK